MRKKKEVSTILYLSSNKPQEFLQCGGNILIMGPKANSTAAIRYSGKIRITTVFDFIVRRPPRG